MITLAEQKAYLNITDTSKDTILTSCVDSAKKRLDNLTNRKLEWQEITEYFEGEGLDYYYPKCFPLALTDITSIKYYDSSTNTYVDLIDIAGDTIANSVEVVDNKIILNKGYIFSGRIQIVYYAGYKATKVYKTISAISQSTTYALVTIGGHSYEVGTVFYISGVTGFLNNCNGAFMIEDVTATQVKFTFDLGTGSYTSGATAEFDSNLTNSTPYDLKQALYYLASKYYYDSPNCDSPRMGLTSKNFNAGSSGGVSYDDIEKEVEKIAQKYRSINVG